MRKNALVTIAALGLLALASPAAAQEQPKFGLGISNQLNLHLASIGAPAGAGLPFSTISAKGFFGDKFAAEGNFGMLVLDQDPGDADTVFLFGGKFHITLHRFTHSSFFTNVGFHFVHASGPDILGLIFNVNLGWEYILPAGLPGLGFSPEFGFSFSHINPDGDDNNLTAVQIAGYGQEFPYLLMNIRYYFM